VKCFWLHLNRVSLIYSNALSFRSGEHPFSFLHALTCCFLQAPGHTNARCQCSINASARRLTRGVWTRVNIGAVHFCTEGDQAIDAVGWKKKLTWQRPRKKRCNYYWPTLIFHPLIIHPFNLFHPKPIDYCFILFYFILFFGIKWKFPQPPSPKNPLQIYFFLITKWKLQKTSWIFY
jgi:hypothetical protein